MVDHLAQVLRAPLQLSHCSGDLPGCLFNPVARAVEKAPGQEVFWLQEAAGDLSFLCFPPSSEESMGKTRSFSRVSHGDPQEKAFSEGTGVPRTFSEGSVDAIIF